MVFNQNILAELLSSVFSSVVYSSMVLVHTISAPVINVITTFIVTQPAYKSLQYFYPARYSPIHILLQTYSV